MTESVFYCKLSEVLHFLLSLKNPVSDDTCLQRLLDVIKEKYEEWPGWVEFIERATQIVSDLETSVLAFSLHLCAQYVNMQGLVDAAVVRFYEAVSQTELWRDSSVGTAYFQSLTKISQTDDGWKWLVQQSDYVKQAQMTLQENTSIFLHTAGRRFLSTVLDKKCTANNDQSPAFSMRQLGEEMGEDLVRALSNAGSPSKSCVLYLDNLTSLFSSCELLLDEARKKNVVENLLTVSLAPCTRSSSQELCQTLLINCLSGDREASAVFVQNTILQMDVNELEDMDILQFHKLVIKLNQSFPDIAGGKLQDIVVIPLLVALNSPPSRDNDLFAKFQSAMTRKGTYVQLVLQAVAAIVNEDGYFTTFLKLLQQTHPHYNSGSTILLNNVRVQLKLLEGILSNTANSPSAKDTTDMLDTLMVTVKDSSVHSLVQEKGLECVLSYLAILEHQSEGMYMKIYLPMLCQILERHVVDPKWENRDTAVEITGKLVSSLKDRSAALQVVAASSVLSSVWQCVNDCESYVRASTIKLPAALAVHSSLWSTFTAQTGSHQDDIIYRLIEVSRTDTEAFPRRAAVSSLTTIFCHRRLSEAVQREIFSTLLFVMSDLDWEVKANALDFWQSVCEVKLPCASYVSGVECGVQSDQLLILRDTGFCHAVVMATEDYDQHVCEKSYKILKNLRQRLAGDIEDLNLKCPATSGEVNVNGCTKAQDISTSTGSDVIFTEFFNILTETDLEKKLDILCGSVDEYCKNPVALLEDILSEDKDIANENFVDCY